MPAVATRLAAYPGATVSAPRGVSVMPAPAETVCLSRLRDLAKWERRLDDTQHDLDRMKQSVKDELDELLRRISPAPDATKPVTRKAN